MVGPSFLFSFLYRQWFVTPIYPTTDCTGKTYIVTGANIGLGKEAARHLVRLGAAKVILACRSASKGEAAARDIEATTSRPNVVEVWPLDLESIPSVQAFAARAARELPRLDGVLENAGVATSKFKRVPSGDESTLAVNVTSTFLLALLLLPQLRATGHAHNSRPTLTVVSSDMHLMCALPEADAPSVFDALNDEKSANMNDRYPVSKLLEVLVVREIAREHSAAQLGVTVNLLNPGFCHSGLTREIAGNPGIRLFKAILARSTEVGSRTLVHANLQAEGTHGEYLSECKVIPVGGVAAGKKAAEVQKKVWSELKAKLEAIQPGVSKALDV